MIIGRQSEDGVVDLDLLPDVTASRRHALITYRDYSFWIEDLGSRSGTWINDQRIAKKIAVTASDQIKIGQTTLRLYRPDLDASVEALADSEPNYPQSDENLLEQGSFTSSVSAMQSPSDLLLARQGDASLDIVKGRLSAFYELGTALGTAQSVEPLLKIVVNHLCKAIPGAQRGALFLLNDRKLYLKAYSPERSKPSVSLYLARLAIGKQEAFTWRYDAPGETNRLSDSILGHGIRCAMYAPLIWQDQVLGIAYVDNYRTSDAFTREDLRLLMAMVSQATVFVKITRYKKLCATSK